MNEIALHYIQTHPDQPDWKPGPENLNLTSDPYSAQICLYWQGHNLLQVSCSYAAAPPRLLRELPFHNCKILPNAFSLPQDSLLKNLKKVVVEFLVSGQPFLGQKTRLWQN